MADIDDTANFPEDFRTNLARLKAKWKAALKRNKKLLLKCPNYEKCQFKCGSVGGMNYHFIRCEGVAPTFKCAQCSRQYESRTGLNYHMMSSHTGDATQESEVEAPPSRPVRSTSSPAKPLLQPTPPPQKAPPTAPKTPPATHNSPPTTQKATPTPTPVPSTASPLAKPKKPPGKPPGRRGKGERGRKPKSSTITIPSIEYPDEYKSYLPQWRVEMKDNKIIKCPNYEECGFKCTTVNGMKYHYVRCNKDNPPEFNCEVCEKKFQCRTGLVWHLKKHHKLVDIHPTRGGGFKGTLPTNDPLLGAGEPTVVGKKISRRGEECPGKPKRLLQQSNGEGEEELFSRKRLRKSSFPRRTAEDILQNVNMCVLPPTPKLGPQPSKFPMPPVEFHITDSIPTDVNHYGSAVICLGEEALVWQKMYSDSEDESDGSHSVDREFKFQASASSSPTASDQSSDEDYSCSFSRKKKAKGRPRGGPKRAPAAKEREREVVKPKDKLAEVAAPFMRVVQPLVDQKPALDHVLLQSSNINPPPVLVKPERQMPALIKASKGMKRSREPKDEEYVPPSLLVKKERQKPQVQVQPQIHPVVPPGLIRQHPKMRQPPPLVRKTEPGWSVKARGESSHPAVVVPSQGSSVGAASRSKMATKGYSTSISDLIASSSSSFPSRKETSRGSEYQGPSVKKTTVSQLTETKKHYRTAKPVTVQASSSYSVVKGLKGTQAEFQSGTPLSGVTHHYTQASSAAVPVQNIVTPMQIVQGPVPPGHNVMQMPAFQNVAQLPPGMILVQSPTGMALKPGEIPYHLAQGGQAYQLVTAQSQGEGSQKVSVIMNPNSYPYFTQLDGPPSPARSKKSKSTKQLRERFEAARKEEQAKLTRGLLELQDGSQGTSDLEAKQNDHFLHHADDDSTGLAASGSNSLPGSRTHTRSARGRSDTKTARNIRKSCSSEALMTEQLKSYFKKGERARKAKCFSPPLDNPTADHLPQPHSQEVAAHAQRRKRVMKRTQSVTSSGRSVSVSPVSVKSPKSPRLVVSPTLFSPTAGGTHSSPLGVLPSPGSGRSSKSPQLSVSPPLCSPIDTKPSSRPLHSMAVQPVSAANSAPVHLPASKPVKSVATAKKKEQKRLALTSPDLSNLFLPDNVPHTGLAPEPPQRPPGFSTSASERRPLEFSSTLPQGHASFLQKPIPLKRDDGIISTDAPPHLKASDKNYGSESVTASAPDALVEVAREDGSQDATHGSPISLRLTATAEATTDSVQVTASGIEERVGIDHLEVPAGNTNSSNSNDSSESPSTDNSQKPSPSGLSEEAESRASDGTGEDPKSSQQPCSTTSGDGAESLNSPEAGKLGKRKTPDVVGGGDLLKVESSPSPAKRRSPGRPRKVVDFIGKKRGPGRPPKLMTATQSDIASEFSSVTVSDSHSVDLESASPSMLPMQRGIPHKNLQTSESHSGSLEQSPGVSETPIDVDVSDSNAAVLSDSQSLDSEPALVSIPPPVVGRRKRGRPRKGETTPHSVAMSDSRSLEPESDGTATPPPVIRKRGRPRKGETTPHSVSMSDSRSLEPESDGTATPPPPKRKRGRPTKFQSGSELPHTATSATLTHTDTSEPAASSFTLDNLSSDNVPGPSQDDVALEASAKKQGRSKLSDGQQSSPAKAVFYCSKCDKNYLSKQALNMHMASVHPPELGKDATLGEYVKMWRKLLRSVKLIGCPKCSTFRCSSATAMKYHFQKCGKSKEELTIHCPECGKAYCSKPGLDYHMKTVHQPTPSPKEDPLLPKTSLFAEPDLSQPLPPRRAATQAGSRLQQLAQTMAESGREDTADSAASTSQPSEASGDSPADSSDVSAAIVLSNSQATSEVGIQTVSFKKPPQQPQQQSSSSRAQVVIPGFTTAQIAEFRDKIRKEKSMKCPFEECQKDFSSIPGLYYHLRNHDNKALAMPCPVCGRVLQSQRRLENHLRAKHEDCAQLENSLDTEYTPGDTPGTSRGRATKIGGDSDSDEEMAEDWEAELVETRTSRKPWAERDHGQRTETAHMQRCVVPTSYERYQNTVRETLKALWSEEQLFAEWRPQLSHWARAEPQELPSYLPLPLISLPFSFHPTVDDPQQNHTLPLFATMATEHSSVMLFAGGPVWALDWLPAPEPMVEQYVALVAHRDLDETFPTNAPLTHKGLLQLWNVGRLSNIPDGSDPLPRPRLELGMAHEWGCIRALRWCPSGCWETKGEEEEGLPRLGLLGVACSDGCLRILSIPHPCNLLSELSPSNTDTMADRPLNESSSSHIEGEATSVQEPRFVKAIRVSATLIPSGLGVTDWSNFGQCLCLDWLPGDGHSRIAAGFSNGAVCIWDLHSRFLRQRDSTPGLALHPAVQLTAHVSECRCLAWCPLNNNYMFTGGHDKFINVWDIREPHDPQERQERAILREAYWPLLWCGIFSVDDQPGMKTSGVSFTSYLLQQRGSGAGWPLAQASGPIAGASYCMWTDRVASGSFCGELHTMAMPSNFYVVATTKYRVSPVCQLLYHYKLESLNSTANTAEPLSALSLDDRPTTSDTEEGCDSTTNSHSVPSTFQTDSRTNESDSVPLFSKDVTDSHRILFIHKPTKKQLPKSYSVDSNLTTSINKVSWNPNEHSYEWLLAATNCGLVHLLRVPKPIEKPHK